MGKEGGRERLFRILGKERFLNRDQSLPQDWRTDLSREKCQRLVDLQEDLQDESPNHLLNRKSPEGTVQAYSGVMTDPGWRVTHEAFMWDVTGACKDGIQRLRAGARCSKSVPIPHALVSVDYPTDIGMCIEGNRPRSPLDQIHISGKHSTATRLDGAIMRFMEPLTAVCPLSASGPVGNRKTFAEELDRRLTKHWHALRFVMDATQGRRQKGITAPVFSAAVKAFYYFPEPERKERLARFLFVLVTGRSVASDEVAATLLRDYLMVHHPHHNGSGQSRQLVHLRTQRAIELFMSCKEDIERSSVVKTEVYPLSD